jgi:hypothetical protein
LTVIREYGLLVFMPTIEIPELEDGVLPPWFGALGRTARAVTRHDMSAIRESIARGVVRDRDL